jgi:hypothetical protein
LQRSLIRAFSKLLQGWQSVETPEKWGFSMRLDQKVRLFADTWRRNRM